MLTLRFFKIVVTLTEHAHTAHNELLSDTDYAAYIALFCLDRLCIVQCIHILLLEFIFSQLFYQLMTRECLDGGH